MQGDVGKIMANVQTLKMYCKLLKNSLIKISDEY